jgi:putative copper resistance protein D
MSAASLLQISSAFLVNACFALVVGTLTARIWLQASAGQVRHAVVVGALHRIELAATGLALAAVVLSFWAAAAVMMGGELGAAAAMIWTMAVQTGYGQAGLAGLTILVAVAGLSAFARRSTTTDFASGLLLVAFAASRASVSHAGEGGMLTLNLAVEWVHLLLIALWLGGVAIAAWLVVPMAYSAIRPGLTINRYLTLLSHAATVALVGIFATGVYNAWQRVGSVQNVMGNTYGTALLVKLAFIGLAVALGGYNKLYGFPALMKSPVASRRVVAVLRVESFLLLGALAAAAVLTSQQPPMAM